MEPKTVLNNIRSFQNGSSGGIDGLRPQHLKDLTAPANGIAGRDLLEALTKLGNLMLTGGVPEAVLEILYGAHLCAISKKDGGLRPVAVGNVLRRLVAKCCSNLCRERASSVFAPHQYGFGIPNGCEIVAHSARTYCSLQHDTPKVLCKIDFSNSFNRVRRDVILKRILTDFSENFPFVNQCYRKSYAPFYYVVTFERPCPPDELV